QLVHYLAWLLVAPVVHPLALIAGKQPERLFRYSRLVGQYLESADDAISSKQRAEPWHTCGEELLAPDVTSQDAEIQQRALHNHIEQNAVACNLRMLAEPFVGRSVHRGLNASWVQPVLIFRLQLDWVFRFGDRERDQ